MIGHPEGAVLLDDVERRTTDQTSTRDAAPRPPGVPAPAATSSGGSPGRELSAGPMPPSGIARRASVGHGEASPRRGRISRAEIAACSAVVVLGLIGFYNAFFTVRDSSVGQTFGNRAFTLPLIIDVGIAAFTALDLCLAARGSREAWVRLFPWALNGATLYLNIVEQPTTAGKVGHAAPPVLWIAAIEAAALLVKRRVEGPKVKPDKIPPALWVLAPGPTVLFWRRMRKQGIVSYAEALERDMHRRLVRARFRREFGRWSWRWSAPDEQLELYRMGKLVAVDVVTEVGASPLPSRRAQQVDIDRDDPGTETGSDRDADTSARNARPRTRDGHSSRNGRRSGGGDEVDVSHLLPRGRLLARALAERGIKLTRRSLTDEWRQDGQTLANRYAGPLVKALQAEGLG